MLRRDTDGKDYDLTITPASYFRFWSAKEGFQGKFREFSLDGWVWGRSPLALQFSKKSKWIGKGLIRAWDNEIAKMRKSKELQKLLGKWYNPAGDDPPQVFNPYKNEKFFSDKSYAGYNDRPVYKRK